MPTFQLQKTVVHRSKKTITITTPAFFEFDCSDYSDTVMAIIPDSNGDLIAVSITNNLDYDSKFDAAFNVVSFNPDTLNDCWSQTSAERFSGMAKSVSEPLRKYVAAVNAQLKEAANLEENHVSSR